jgi:hypothetical protein
MDAVQAPRAPKKSFDSIGRCYYFSVYYKKQTTLISLSDTREKQKTAFGETYHEDKTISLFIG